MLAPRAQNQDRAKRVLARTGSQGSVTKAQVVGSDGHPKGTRPQLFVRKVHTLHGSQSPWQVSWGEHGAVLPSGNGRAQGETSQTHQQCRMGIRCVKAKNYRGNTPAFHKRPALTWRRESWMSLQRGRPQVWAGLVRNGAGLTVNQEDRLPRMRKGVSTTGKN